MAQNYLVIDGTVYEVEEHEFYGAGQYSVLVRDSNPPTDADRDGDLQAVLSRLAGDS